MSSGLSVRSCKHKTPSSLLSPLFSLPSSPFSFFTIFANTTKTAPVSPLNRCHSNCRFHDSSLSSSPSPLLSPLFSLPSSPFSFYTTFANTTETAPVLLLNQCHCDFRFHDSSLSPSPLFSLSSSPLSFLFFSPTLRKQRRCRG